MKMKSLWLTGTALAAVLPLQSATAVVIEYSGAISDGNGLALGVSGGLGNSYEGYLEFNGTQYLSSRAQIGTLLCFSENNCGTGSMIGEVSLDTARTGPLDFDAQGQPIGGTLVLNALVGGLGVPLVYSFDNDNLTITTDAIDLGLVVINGQVTNVGNSVPDPINLPPITPPPGFPVIPPTGGPINPEPEPPSTGGPLLPSDPGISLPPPPPASAVPVPAAAWLFGSALLGLVGANRRR